MKALVASFLLASLVLTGCDVAKPGVTQTESSVPSSSSAEQYSRLDKAGIERIKKSRTTRLDMTSGKLTKESVGLEAGISQAPDVLIKEGLMDLNIDAPQA